MTVETAQVLVAMILSPMIIAVTVPTFDALRRALSSHKATERSIAELRDRTPH